MNKQAPVNIASDAGHLEVVRLLLSRPGLGITTEDKWGDVIYGIYYYYILI